MYRKYIKRLLDIIISLTLIIVLFPIMLIVWIITLIDLGRPTIDIRLPREGMNKRPFYMYKFRTRIYDKNGNSTYSKISRFMDRTSLNELPQLFNILKGEMSFIGPRAFICGEKLPDYEISPKRYLVKPGIIGLAHAKGGRFLTHEGKLACDAEYYDNLSFMFDLKIFFKSIKSIIEQILY